MGYSYIRRAHITGAHTTRDTLWPPLLAPLRVLTLTLALALTPALTLVLAIAAPAHGDGVRMIADNTALNAALQEGVTDDTLVLAPGVYGPLVLRGPRNEVPAVIRSADPDHPAEIIGLTATGFTALRIEDVHLRYRFTAGDPIHMRPFQFRDCAGLAITSSRIEGDEVRQTGTRPSDPFSNGLPTGLGLSISQCRHVALSGLHISRFHRGLVVRETRDLAVTASELTALRLDGMNFAQVEDVRIEDNYIHSFRRSADPLDHSDMIQFWTNGTTQPSRGITIRNNLLHSGPGMFTQSIFMRNDLVDRGLAGPEMFYADVLIEENVIVNAHLHGITVGETNGLTIRRNTLAFNPLSPGADPDRRLWRPAIRVAPDARDVRLAGNLAAGITGFEAQPSWTMGPNLMIQDQTALAPGFYGRVFIGMPGGDPLHLGNFRYRPDGEAADLALGAARLRE